jgi:hypothetical protein
MKPVPNVGTMLQVIRRMYDRYFAREIDNNHKDCFYSLQIFLGQTKVTLTLRMLLELAEEAIDKLNRSFSRNLV